MAIGTGIGRRRMVDGFTFCTYAIVATDTVAGDFVVVDGLCRFPARREVTCATVVAGRDVSVWFANGKRGVVVTIGAAPDDFVMVDSNVRIPHGSGVARTAFVRRGNMSQGFAGYTRFGTVARRTCVT
jgi:hypothetical protein